MFLYILLTECIVCGLIGGTILARKGFSPILGVFVGVGLGFLPFTWFLAPITFLMMLAIPSTNRAKQLADSDRKTRVELAVESQTRACPKCGRLNSIATRVCPRCEERLIVDVE